MAAKKAKIFLDVKMPGGTPFKLNSFYGIERLSNLFEYRLLMAASSRDVKFDSLIGKSATVTLHVGNKTRTYNGIIGVFEQEQTPFNPLNASTVYRAVLYPKLWQLTFSGECRIFQNMATTEIIRKVLEENKVPFSDSIRSAGKQQREFCVQYNETNFNFISRLMEEEGIYYFFEQTRDGHRLVLADSPEGHLPCPNASSASFHDAAATPEFMLKVSSCFISQQIVRHGDTLKSYNYLTPKTPLTATSTGPSTGAEGTLTTYNQVYDKKARGDDLAKVKIQSEDWPQKMVEGESSVPFFLAGYKFSLENHPRRDANKSYVLYEVVHEAKIVAEGEADPIYKNSYRGFPASTPFRPSQVTPKPRIFGTQTAKVTGKPHEEIYTEEYGRIKVKFHWDPSKKDDDTTSCWIRVATLWSGQSWGTLFTPRIGQEVVVSFIDGDPDKPLVIGSVYNGENKPPYLPSDPTKSTIKSQTSKKGEGQKPGYNEFRFEDKKEKEEIYIHAQKDFKIDIQNDHDITIVGGNRKILLESKSEKEEEREGKKSNDSLTLKNGDKSLQIDKGDYSIKLDEGNITITCKKGDVKFDVTGDIDFKCSGNFSVEASKDITFNSKQSISATATENVKVKAGSAITANAGGDVTVDAGGAADIQAGGDISVSAGGAADIQAGGDASVAGGGALELSGGGTVTMEGATVEVTGATILLNG